MEDLDLMDKNIHMKPPIKIKKLSNCAALEILDDKYRLIVSDASYHNIEAYGIKSYWENGKYLQEKIAVSPEFKPLDQLLSKNIKSETL